MKKNIIVLSSLVCAFVLALPFVENKLFFFLDTETN